MKSFSSLLLCVAALALPAVSQAKDQSIVLGGGCFWCMDACFKLVPGVDHVTCGYAGGNVSRPTYQEVCSETTGHAEVVKIDYDPSKVSLPHLLALFWKVHDPTQVGGQGNDMGSSYRSIILYADDAQKAAAESSRDEAQKRLARPITTEITALRRFWEAEDYHQDYFEKHPHEGYCRVVIQPKVDKLGKVLQAPAPTAAK